MVEMFRLSFIYIFSGTRENSNDFRFVDFKSHTELLQNKYTAKYLNISVVNKNKFELKDNLLILKVLLKPNIYQ